MDVLVSPDLPTSTAVRTLQRQVVACTMNNHLSIGTDRDGLELIALLVPGTSGSDVLVHFALRSQADKHIRHLVGGTDKHEPVPVTDVLNGPNTRLDETLFVGIVTRASAIFRQVGQGKTNMSLH